MKKQNKTQKKRQFMKMKTPPPRKGLNQGREGNKVGEESEERVITALKLLQGEVNKPGSKIRITYIRRNTPYSSGDRKKQDIVVFIEHGHKMRKHIWHTLQVKTSEKGGKKFLETLEAEMRKLEKTGRTLPKMIPKLVIAREHDSIFDIMDSTSKALGLRVSA